MHVLLSTSASQTTQHISEELEGDTNALQALLGEGVCVWECWVRVGVLGECGSAG